ncbi:MAG: DegT/DnrJ/EryC1/StrS family aminotransferase [Rubricoccaceae bacterium]
MLQMVDLHAQVASLRPQLEAAVARVLERGAFVRGPFVAAFEQELASWIASAGAATGAPPVEGELFALGVGNGTDALQIALMALGVGPGDEVVTSAFTFVATAEAAALLGARVVFADIDPETFMLRPEAVAAALSARTKAVVPVHLYGQVADMDALRAVCSARGIPLVEDAAQAIGALWQGRPATTLGALGCLSFYPSKNLGAYGDGGAIVSADRALFAEARAVANHGAEAKYHHRRVGVNSRLDALQAAILSVKLPHLHVWNAARRAAANLYDACLEGSAFARRPARLAGAHHVFHQYTLRVPPDARDALREHLRAHGIPTMVYYPEPLHVMPAFAGAGFGPGDLPETEQAAREVVSLPMHPELRPSDVARIADAVRAFAGERAESRERLAALAE